MKTSVLAAAMVLMVLDCLGQGTVNFVNVGVGLNAPVLTCDGTMLFGPEYLAALLAGTTSTNLSEVGEAQFVAAGYFFGGVVEIPGIVGGGIAWIRIVVWDSTLGGTTNKATFAEAQAYGQSVWGDSPVFSVATGNQGFPPTPPATLVGLSSFNVGGTASHFGAFYSQPTNQTVSAGGTANFAVGAAACPPPVYQWYFNGAILPGATDDHVSITNAQLVNNGDYWVVLSNPEWGSRTSTSATLTVTGTAPTITGQPRDQTIQIGANVGFEVGALGAPPLAYQWLFDGNVIRGATNSTLTLMNVRSEQAGLYAVIVANSFGSVTSSNAQLRVTAPPATVLMAASPPGLGGAMSLAILMAANGNENALAFSLNFPTPLLSFVSITLGAGDASANLVINTNQLANGELGVALALPVGATFNAGTQEIARVSLNAAPVGSSTAAQLTFGDQPAIRQLSDPFANSLAVNFVGASVNIPAYAGHGIVNFVNLNTVLGLNAPVLACGGTKVPGPDYRAGLFAGASPDTLSLVTQTPLLPGASAGYFNGGVVGIPGVAGGGTGWFQVVVWDSTLGGTTKDATFDQARTNNESIWGQSSTFSAVTGNPSASPPGFPAGLVGLDSITLGGNAPHFVAFSSQPTNQTVQIGVMANFFVSAVACPAPEYQWYFNGSAIPGATDDHLSVTNARRSDAGNYQVVLSNTNWGSRASSIATLTVIGTPPSIETEPQGQSIQFGGNVDFNVIAQGIPAPAYQWRFNGSIIPGATYATLSLTNVQLNQGGTYTVVVTNDFGSVISTPAVLIVNPVVIVAQPHAQTVLPHASADFTVGAVGAPPLAYQWLFNNHAIPGETNSTLHLADVQVNQSGKYTAVVSDPFVTMTSLPAMLTVEELRVSDQTVFVGSNALLTVQVIGYPGLSFTWFWNSTNQLAPTSGNSTLLLTNVQPSQAGAYYVVATTAIGAITSAPAMLTVSQLMITSQPQSQFLIAGTTADFAVGVLGVPPVTYQWLFNESAIAGATSSMLHLVNVQSDRVGAYVVIVTNMSGAVTSAPAMLSLGGLQVSSQTAEIGSGVGFIAEEIGIQGLNYKWFWNGTTQVAPSSMNPRLLILTNVQPSQAGSYSVVATTTFGSITSAPSALAIIPRVPRQWTPVLLLSGQPGLSLNVEVTEIMNPVPNWSPFVNVVLTNDSQWHFDFTLPIPLRRFYRALDASPTGGAVPLDITTIPALTLTGSIGNKVRVDAINRFGPTDAWFTVDTVTLTNNSQVYFDVSALEQPPRLHRLVQVP